MKANFKDKLVHEVDNIIVPNGDDLWQKIESQLPVNKPRRKFPFFIVSIGLICLLTFVFFDSLLLKDTKASISTNTSHVVTSREEEVNTIVAVANGNSTNNDVQNNIDNPIKSRDLLAKNSHRESASKNNANFTDIGTDIGTDMDLPNVKRNVVSDVNKSPLTNNSSINNEIDETVNQIGQPYEDQNMEKASTKGITEMATLNDSKNERNSNIQLDRVPVALDDFEKERMLKWEYLETLPMVHIFLSSTSRKSIKANAVSLDLDDKFIIPLKFVMPKYGFELNLTGNNKSSFSESVLRKLELGFFYNFRIKERSLISNTLSFNYLPNKVAYFHLDYSNNKKEVLNIQSIPKLDFSVEYQHFFTDDLMLGVGFFGSYILPNVKAKYSLIDDFENNSNRSIDNAIVDYNREKLFESLNYGITTSMQYRFSNRTFLYLGFKQSLSDYTIFVNDETKTNNRNYFNQLSIGARYSLSNF